MRFVTMDYPHCEHVLSTIPDFAIRWLEIGRP